jgi:IS30 family transposase
MTPELVNKIKQNLEEKWSPEQIVGRCPEYNISHTTIYTMIHKDQKLRKNLRHERTHQWSGQAVFAKRNIFC